VIYLDIYFHVVAKFCRRYAIYDIGIDFGITTFEKLDILRIKNTFSKDGPAAL
jgi:hypothetical protein